MEVKALELSGKPAFGAHRNRSDRLDGNGTDGTEMEGRLHEWLEMAGRWAESHSSSTHLKGLSDL